MFLIRFLWRYKIGTIIAGIYSGSVISVFISWKYVCSGLRLQEGICYDGWGVVFIPFMVTGISLPSTLINFIIMSVSFIFLGAMVEFFIRKFFHIWKSVG